MNSVKHHSQSLQYAHEELKGDREFMVQAAKYKGAALQYASLGLKVTGSSSCRLSCTTALRFSMHLLS
eukprot:404561-Heterocapsa_arctica.AAC.1